VPVDGLSQLSLSIQGQAFDGNAGARRGAELDHGARETAGRLDGSAGREAVGRNAVAFADQPRVIRQDPPRGNNDSSGGPCSTEIDKLSNYEPTAASVQTPYRSQLRRPPQSCYRGRQPRRESNGLPDRRRPARP
jgi:hypothetical protein